MTSNNFRFGVAPYEALKRDYMVEISAICEATGRADFLDIATHLSDYSGWLKSRAELDTNVTDLLRACDDPQEISIKTQHSGIIIDAKDYASLACACHLLHGSQLSVADLEPDTLKQHATRFMDSCQDKPEDYRKRLFGKFHTMDAIRPFQFLRALGLVKRQTEDFYQLGLGTAEGTRDAISIHLQPDLSITENFGSRMISLSQVERRAAETVIVDAFEEYREHFQHLNADDSSNTRGYCSDTLEFLANHEDYFDRKRNLVTALRIDHRMLPDVHRFLSLLAPCIEEDCDLVMTIGAGDTIEEFKGRLDKFREICDTLKSVGLNPVIFRLYRSAGSYNKRRNSLYYGNIRASSYEILYCRLSPVALSKL